MERSRVGAMVSLSLFRRFLLSWRFQIRRAVGEVEPDFMRRSGELRCRWACDVGAKWQAGRCSGEFGLNGASSAISSMMRCRSLPGVEAVRMVICGAVEKRAGLDEANGLGLGEEIKSDFGGTPRSRS